MPDFVTNQQTAAVFGDAQFLGIDALHAPGDIPPGHCRRADNLILEAGRLQLRPGFVAQLAANVAAPARAGTPVVQADGTTHLWFAAGTSLYRWIPGTTAPVAVTLPSQIAASGQAFNGAEAVIGQYAGYVYVADNVARQIAGADIPGLLRFAADGTNGQIAAGLKRPDAPLSAQLLARPYLPAPPFGSVVETGADPSLTIPATTGQSFVAAGDASFDTASTFWTLAGSASVNTVDPPNAPALQLDSRGEAATSRITNLANPNTPAVFEVSCDLYIKPASDTQDGTEKNRITATCYPLVSGGGTPATVTSDFEVSNPAGFTGRQRFVLDCRNVGFPVKSISFKFEALE